jgi:DNA-binding NarL/FixJ family response regulator
VHGLLKRPPAQSGPRLLPSLLASFFHFQAKGEGKHKGRAPTARAKSADIHRLAAEGLTREAIATQLKIGVASVYRALRAA